MVSFSEAATLAKATGFPRVLRRADRRPLTDLSKEARHVFDCATVDQALWTAPACSLESHVIQN